MNLLQELQGRFTPALAKLVDDPAPYVGMIKPTADDRHGDYQANCAMALAKHLGRKPRDVAESIVGGLDAQDLLHPPDIAGPGFINLRLRDEWLAERLRAMERDERLGIPPVQSARTFVIDYSSPNVAKPMHIGHIRSTIIGESLARLLRFLGHKVVGDNHLGDWGTQMGMILWGWKNHRDEEAYRRDPVQELARLYRLAAGTIKGFEKFGRDLEKVQALEAAGKQAEAAALATRLFGDVPRAEIETQVAAGREVDVAARRETALLHQGDPENRRLWQEFMPHCLAALRKVYDRLDVEFDEWLGESAYDPMLPEVVADLEQAGLARESEGALVVFVEGMDAPFMIRKSDGAFNYATSDLATIRYRREHFDPDALLYVVDHRQSDHFKALFDVARRWGHADLEMRHIAFGTIMGKDKKPYKTREGDVVGLESLLDEAVARARKVVDENSPDLPEEQRQEVAEIVGLGAVKYADLSQNRTSDYVFDWDKLLAMDGNTGAYMQYAYARNRSIFRKGDVDAAQLRREPPPVLLTTPFERQLGLLLLRLEETLHAAAADYQPSVLTAYLWELARAYSGFFQNCPVLKAESDELRRSRLVLCDLTARVLRLCLDLLGIRTADRM